MTDVWMVWRYFGPDVACDGECNGVFRTKEDALAICDDLSVAVRFTLGVDYTHCSEFFIASKADPVGKMHGKMIVKHSPAQFKHLPVEFGAKAIADDGTFSGYASTFGNKDLGGDIVMPGAFKGAKAAKVKMLWQHDPSQPIGVWESMKEDDTGLAVKGRLLTKTAKGAEAYELMKAGAVDGLSIGFITLDDEYDARKNARRLKSIDLKEISIVTFPMNTSATVSAVKALSIDEIRDLEALLREKGLSRTDAVTAVSGFKAWLLRDAGETAPAPREAAGEAAILGAFDAIIARLKA